MEGKNRNTDDLIGPTIPPSTHRACHTCTRELGSEPGTARLVRESGSVRAVELCAACAGAPASQRNAARIAVMCTECGQNAPVTARAVAAGGQISVLCGRCSGDEPEPSSPPSPPRPWHRRPRPLGAGAIAVVAMVFLGFALTGDDSSAAPAMPTLLDATLNNGERQLVDTELKVPPRERPQVHDLSYAKHGDEEIPLVWYHPLAKERELPSHSGRRFGANRPGDRPSECGEGHCGVDLGHTRGRIIHAARPGIVDRIMRVGDRLGGKYVRLYHPEGFFTYYMHLDVIRPTLIPGVEVAAGEPLGLLGSTGIQNSPPHLHFAVSRLLETGAQLHIDPEPMLRQAVVLDEPAPFPDAWRQPGPRIARAYRPAQAAGGSDTPDKPQNDAATTDEDSASAKIEDATELEAVAETDTAVGIEGALDMGRDSAGPGAIEPIGMGAL